MTSVVAPKMQTCYVCKKGIGSSSLAVHELQCLKRFKAEQESLPEQQRKPLPVKAEARSSEPRNTISVRFHLDERADVVNEINGSLLKQGLVLEKASKAHIPLVLAVKQTPSDDEVDSVLDVLCRELEVIAGRLEDFDFQFPGIGTFFNSGGRRDNGVVFLEPTVTPAVRKAQSSCFSAVENAIAGTRAVLDMYSHPSMWVPHLTIAKGVKRAVFSEAVRQVNQWALEGPFDIPEGDKSVMATSVTCIALKVKNYKGTGKTTIFEYKLATSASPVEHRGQSN